MSECTDDGCVVHEAPNGTLCDEAGDALCVWGACVDRGCGDGYRERPPSALREGCDDGNDVSGDGCSAACVPEVRRFEPPPEEEFTNMHIAEGESSIGVDEDGRVLIAWRKEPLGGDALFAVRAIRTGRGSAPLDGEAGAPFEIFESPQFVPRRTPVVLGLPGGGWVVAWVGEPAGDRIHQTLYRIVRPDGTMTPIQRGDSEEAGLGHRTPAIAGTDDGFFLVWQELRGADGRSEDLRARRFRTTGASMGDSFPIATDDVGTQRNPTAAAHGDVTLVAWTSWRRGISDPELHFRRFERGEPIDTVQVFVTTDVVAARATALDDGSFLLVWTERREERLSRAWAMRVSEDDETGGLVMGPTVAVVDDEDAGQQHVTAAPALGATAAIGFLTRAGFVSGADVLTFGEGASPLPATEAMTLRAAFAADAPSALALTPGHRGGALWVSWTYEDPDTTDERLAAFFLPLD